MYWERDVHNVGIVLQKLEGQTYEASLAKIS